MRRATASDKFRTQVVLVYLQYISAKIHLLVHPKSSSAVLVIYYTQQVCVCD